MDRKQSRWKWVPLLMPLVTRNMAEKRAEFGDDHIRECWRRGVECGEPGWFFAREGAVALGTPWPEIADMAGWCVHPKQAIVCIRPKESGHASAR